MWTAPGTGAAQRDLPTLLGTVQEVPDAGDVGQDPQQAGQGMWVQEA